jgi:hypothetical protein
VFIGCGITPTSNSFSGAVTRFLELAAAAFAFVLDSATRGNLDNDYLG